MAANYITIGSRFTPFSYDELVRPLQEATQAHQAVQEAYDTYAENTGLIGAELDPTLDADIINNIYNPYNETLESAAMTLASQGLTPSARKSLSELRRRFGREITPIKLASDARKTARENWDKLSAADRSLMTNANPYYLGLTSYMNGKSPKTAYVSGNELYARGKEITQAMSQVMRNIPSSESTALQNQYWRIIQQKGFTSKEMNDFINGVIEDFPELNRQMNAILDASGIYDNDFSDQDIARAKQYIKDGMIAGMSGDTKVDYLQNRAWGLKENPDDAPNLSDLYAPPKIPWGQSIAKGRKNRQVSKIVEMGNSGSLKTINYNGEDIAVPDNLYVQIYYQNNPEEREEYLRERQEYEDSLMTPEIRERIDSERAAGERAGTVVTSYTADQIARQVEAAYPSLMRPGQIRRKIKRFKKDHDKWSEEYSLSPDPGINLTLGSNFESMDMNEENFGYAVKFDPTQVNKWKEMINNNGGRLYEYDRTTGAIGKMRDINEPATVKSIVPNQNGEKIVTLEEDDSKSYLFDGDSDERYRTNSFRAIKEALLYFKKNDSNSKVTTDGRFIHIPGTGNYEDIEEVDAQSVDPSWIGSNIAESDEEMNSLIESGTLKPIEIDSLVQGYVATVKSDGVVYRIVTSPSGVILSILDSFTASRGATPYQANLLSRMIGQGQETSIMESTRKVE